MDQQQAIVYPVQRKGRLRYWLSRIFLAALTTIPAAAFVGTYIFSVPDAYWTTVYGISFYDPVGMIPVVLAHLHNPEIREAALVLFGVPLIALCLLRSE
ncbi:hypothetical protein HHS34_005565 [Acidithiobacillus montserratensis]|uniref:Uncharacterized protein n=1 Tax=Acidithiobacillus montserratensis TaxID=2729135 RepID=A0ACD5HJH4_9PROT|nr:hypothetical protein [Acidithiobacillus montserratensis]MBU2747854.1 hypothetical protein [Acidithiobacillus montserratensis]